MNRKTKRRLRKLTTQAAKLVLKGDLDGAEALCRTHQVPMGLVEKRAEVLQREAFRRDLKPFTNEQLLKLAAKRYGWTDADVADEQVPIAVRDLHVHGEAVVSMDVAERAGWWKE